MPPESFEWVNLAVQLVIALLLFVMWLLERRDKHGAIRHKNEMQHVLLKTAEVNSQLVNLVQTNTKAMVKLESTSQEIASELRATKHVLGEVHRGSVHLLGFLQASREAQSSSSTSS